MRKIFLAIVILLILTTTLLTGCRTAPGSNEDDLTIISTVFPGYDFAKQVVGDKAQVSMLLPVGSESHSYEPTPKDIIKIQNCDLFIYTGGESDAWVDDILSSMETPVTVVKMIDCADIYQEEHDHSQENHDHEDEYDEHVWTSPVYAQEIVRTISDKLGEADSENKEFYTENADNYIKELETLDKEFQDFFSGIENPVMVFGDRFPLKHFADRYGITCYSAFPGCSSETEPSAADLVLLINTVKELKLKTVFCIEFSNRNVAESIAESTGTSISQFNTCHNVTQEQLDEGVTYVSLMKENLKVLEEAF